jgi:hypothetical protein
MTTYDVQVFREEELWVADIDDVGATDMLQFADLDVEVRDYVSGMTDSTPTRSTSAGITVPATTTSPISSRSSARSSPPSRT